MIYQIRSIKDLEIFTNMLNTFYEIEVLKSVMNNKGRVYTMKYDTFCSSRGNLKCTVVCDKKLLSTLKQTLINNEFNKGENNEKRR